MFNSGYKKEALNGLKRASEEHKEEYEKTIKNIENLHESRMDASNFIKKVELYINSIANTPKNFKKDIDELSLNLRIFQTEVEKLEIKSDKIGKISGGMAGTGVLAGAGIAAFGPTAAMAIATTFGTASTGTAIATLSGAAATNAALAWLGGGALAVGGGGMVAGETFLALAGPVGWAIGGAALLGGGILASSKNKKLAHEAEENTRKIKKETEKILEIGYKVKNIRKEILDFIECLEPTFNMCLNSGCLDYEIMENNQKKQLTFIVNTTRALSEKLTEKIN